MTLEPEYLVGLVLASVGSGIGITKLLPRLLTGRTGRSDPPLARLLEERDERSRAEKHQQDTRDVRRMVGELHSDLHDLVAEQRRTNGYLERLCDSLAPTRDRMPTQPGE